MKYYKHVIMRNTTYLIIGLIMGYFMAIGCGSNLIAYDSSSGELGSSEWNPLYVKVVQ